MTDAPVAPSPHPAARSAPRRATLSAVLATMLLACPAPADELRLDDGRVLVGKVTAKGDNLEVATRDGVVVVGKAQVKSHLTDEQLRKKLADQARTAGDTAFAHLHLGMQAHAYGLQAEMWRHLDRAVSLPRPAGAAAGEPTAAEGQQLGAQADGRDPLQRRIDDFLARLEPELLPRKYRTAATKVRVHQLLEHLRADTGRGRAAAVEELLVREPNADQDLRSEARRNSDPRRRIGALAALQRRELAGNDRFVQRTAVLDGTREVREAAVQLVRPEAAADAIAYLAPGLMHENPKVRVRTAEAFADLGHHDAVKLLVLAGPNAGAALAAADPGVRAHAAFLQQQAYIRDFNVEVASAAFIADPQVGVLQSGVVLDVTVHGVYEEVTIVRAYRQALKKLTAQDPGNNPRTWATWLAGLQEQAPAATTGKR